MGVIGTSHYFSTMNLGPNVEDTKFGVVSLGTSHYFSKMAALCEVTSDFTLFSFPSSLHRIFNIVL